MPTERLQLRRRFYIAGGVEQMTRAPYVLSKSTQPFLAEMFSCLIAVLDGGLLIPK